MVQTKRSLSAATRELFARRGYPWFSMTDALKILALLFCTCFAPVPASAKETGKLHVRVELTKGERSRDSSSQTTTITVLADAILWEQTYGGRRGRTPPLRKEYKLSAADKRKLVKVIESKNLFVTDSITLPPDRSTYEYFAVSLDLSLDGRKGAVSIAGPRTAGRVEQETRYQDLIALVKELHRIINRQDKTIFYEELILKRPGVDVK